ncbi:hypothetical protein DMC25_13540 [Caulobacter sp. D4A]|uniref:hypothetical protein n=1 Tax=unclassified Caulobacter TaxID=2648921 RepID=UPI000D735C5F|nr:MULTISPECIES: hypothetical protein [unclassified Caulobacter]PXA86743.1 hypothetical protein DMC25_13540 [Caulobacter sp. D4A]PXA95369.1 hypothetical protein DMC18_04160 [Caulobacter sp. D5]
MRLALSLAIATAALMGGRAALAAPSADFVLSEAQQKQAAETARQEDAAKAEAAGLSAPLPLLPKAWRPAPCRLTSVTDVALCRQTALRGRTWSTVEVRYVRGAANSGWRLFDGTYETVAGRYRLASDAKGEHLSLCWERDALTCETVLGPRIDQYGGNDRYIVIARRDLPDETPRFYYVEAAKDGPGTVHGPLTASAFTREKLTLALPEFDGIIVSR